MVFSPYLFLIFIQFRGRFGCRLAGISRCLDSFLCWGLYDFLRHVDNCVFADADIAQHSTSFICDISTTFHLIGNKLLIINLQACVILAHIAHVPSIEHAQSPPVGLEDPVRSLLCFDALRPSRYFQPCQDAHLSSCVEPVLSINQSNFIHSVT